MHYYTKLWHITQVHFQRDHREKVMMNDNEFWRNLTLNIIVISIKIAYRYKLNSLLQLIL